MTARPSPALRHKHRQPAPRPLHEHRLGMRPPRQVRRLSRPHRQSRIHGRRTQARRSWRVLRRHHIGLLPRAPRSRHLRMRPRWRRALQRRPLPNMGHRQLRPIHRRLMCHRPAPTSLPHRHPTRQPLLRTQRPLTRRRPTSRPRRLMRLLPLTRHHRWPPDRPRRGRMRSPPMRMPVSPSLRWS